ncbi:MAG: LysM peptidoglycan-binding domain-containing protein [Dehalococcoidia bacterium]|nr:LysM peptidoglycan-binding domain-containing protein [Dehalococcoidia bacterium]
MSADWRFASERYEEDEGGWLGLVTFVATCIGVGVGLWWLTGPPTMLMSVPDWSYIREALGAAELRDRDVITVTTGIAWLIVGYVLLSVAVRLLFGAAVAVTGGAAWARAALQATSPLTIPVVRRMVDATLAGTIMVSATLHTPSAAFASSAAAAEVIETRVPAQTAAYDSSAATQSVPAPALAAATTPTTYTVVRGDNLWRIAERYLDDGFRWTDIWRLNQHHAMTDGRVFTDPNLIYPGWVLELPSDSVNPEPEPVLDDEESGGFMPEADPTAPDPIPATSTPEPTAVAPAPVATNPPTGGTAESNRTDGDGPSGLKLPEVPAAGGAIVTATAITFGGAVMWLVVQRRRAAVRSDSGRNAPKRPSGDAGRVLATTSALLSALADLDFVDARAVLVREAPAYLEVHLDCPPGDADALVAARHTLGRHLQCAVDGAVDGPTAVRLKVSRMSYTAAALLAWNAAAQPLLIPVGGNASGIHYLNLRAVGSVLVAGARLETHELLTSWLETLAAMDTQDRMAYVADASARRHLDDSLDLMPSLPTDVLRDEDPTGFVRTLEEHLLARSGAVDPAPLLVIASSGEDGSTSYGELEGILQRGPEQDMLVIAVTDRGEIQDGWQSFGARLIFAEDEPDGERRIRLSLPNMQGLVLDPVVVRRAVAPRSRPFVEATAAVPTEPVHVEGDDELTLTGREADGTTPLLEVPDPGDPITPPSANGRHPSEPEIPTVEPRPQQANDGRQAMDRQALLPLDEPERNGDVAACLAPFQATLFGMLRVETASGEVTAWSVQKTRELLAFLLAHGGSPVLRDTAADALWPNGEHLTGHLLPNAAYYIRRALSQAAPDIEGAILITAGQRYQLRSGLFRTDIDAFDAHLARAERLQGHDALVEYERALNLYTADFLEFEGYEWAGPYQQDYRQRFVRAAHRAARLAADGREPALAGRFYEAILKREPTDEEAVRGLMRCHLALGDRSAAKRVFRQLVEDLRETLNDVRAEPMSETMHLLADIGAD